MAHKIDPLLKMMKLRRSANQYLEESSTNTPVRMQCIEEPPEKCVSVDILAEPPPGVPIKADVVFIHGLHGKYIITDHNSLFWSELLNSKFIVCQRFNCKNMATRTMEQ